MKITKLSNVSGISHTMDIPIDPVKYQKWVEDCNAPYVQNYFPELTSSQREFLLSGITDEEWDEIFGKDE